jgi:hypothetical protein
VQCTEHTQHNDSMHHAMSMMLACLHTTVYLVLSL